MSRRNMTEKIYVTFIFGILLPNAFDACYVHSNEVFNEHSINYRCLKISVRGEKGIVRELGCGSVGLRFEFDLVTRGSTAVFEGCVKPIKKVFVTV